MKIYLTCVALVFFWCLSLHLWADGYDEELLRQSAEEYVDAHGGELHQQTKFRFIVIHEDSVVEIEMMNFFNAEITSINRLEKL